MTSEAHHNFQSVSPLLAYAIKENQLGMVKVNKLLLEMIHDVNSIYEKAATSVYQVTSTFQKKLNDLTKDKYVRSDDSFVQSSFLLQKEIECQADIVKTSVKSIEECFLNPLKTANETKKLFTKNCYSYIEAFNEKMKVEERNVSVSLQNYQLAALKVNTIQWNTADKHHTMYQDAHNTHLLQIEKYNSSNKLLYTDVLPRVVNLIEKQQQKMNTSILHHSKYMSTIQLEALEKMQASFDRVSSIFECIELSKDLSEFAMTVKTTDRSVPRVEAVFPSPSMYQNQQLVTLIAPLDNKFVVTASTKPNLQRRYKTLQDETNVMLQLLTVPKDQQQTTGEQSHKDVEETFRFIEKEFNLNVALAQMELYSTEVTDSLNLPPSDSIPNADSVSLNEEPHDFKGLKSLIPLTCYYCRKMVMTFHKGFICKSCRMVVHKKCAMNIPFCVKSLDNMTNSTEETPGNPLDDGYGSLSSDPLSEVTPPVYAPMINGRYSISFPIPNTSSAIPNTASPMNQVVRSGSDARDDDVFQQNHQYPNYHELLPEDDTSALEEPLYCDVSLKNKANANVEEEHLYSDFNVLATELVSINQNQSVCLVESDVKEDSSVPSVFKESKPRYCVALYDLDAADEEHLSLQAGEKIEILDDYDDTWWKGKLSGKEGFFPQNFVLNLVYGDTDRVVKVLYPFVAQYGTGEMSVDEGQILLFLEHDGDGWIRAKSINDEGHVPTSYVEFLC